MAIINNHHCCVYLHPPKTAGTSMRKFVHEYVGGKDCPKHEWASKVKTRMENPRHWDEYFKFATIRNPFDRLYSIYGYYKWGYYNQKPKDIPEGDGGLPEKSVARRLPDTFHDFCLDLENGLGNIIGFPSRMQHLSEFIDLELDYYIRYESMHEDLNDMIQILNERNKIKIHARANKLQHMRFTAKRKDNFKEAYTRETAGIVANYFKEDINKFYPESPKEFGLKWQS